MSKHECDVQYELRLKGLSTPAGTISARVLMDVLRRMIECTERGLRLAVEGMSVKRGRLPKWLGESLNLRVTGLGRGSTVLKIEAPLLGETVGDRISQQEIWYTPPSPNDTALTLLSRSVHDTTAENLESEYYDGGVLSGLLALKPILKTEATSIELSAKARRNENFMLDLAGMEKVERLKKRTPEPRAFIVSGHLNSIEHHRKRFQLVLSDGQVMPGRVDAEFMDAEAMRQFWGRKVTIKGTAYFRPSGKIQLLESHLIKFMESGDEIFEAMPQEQTEAEFVRTVAQTSERRGWLKNIWGKWPGDESVEDLLAALHQT
ncbi:MAG TPA: hypothetical protein PLT00_02650 [Verrucomicrobiota bacterium]|nr:hypothetical protein [Verrucomicrobiota bacterium]HQB15594.1 hypothetical protein [Verrucomicrobiota bacterium]